jgi:hypothetical protein
LESLYCYSTTNGTIKIQEGDASTSIQQKGKIVKFTGNNVCIINRGEMSSIKIDLGTIVEQKIFSKNFAGALAVAKLGVDLLIWETLARETFLNHNFDVSKACYLHLGKPAEVSMVARLENDVNNFQYSTMTKEQLQLLITAELDIIDGKIKSAGEKMISVGQNSRAIELFVASYMFDEAKLVPCQKNDQRLNILLNEAKWEEEFNKNYLIASNLYADCNCFLEAVHAAAKLEGDLHFSTISKLSKLIPPTELQALNLCCSYLEKDPKYKDDMIHILLKLQDYNKLLKVHVQNHSWSDVDILWNDHKHEIDTEIITSYSDWLAGNGRIKEALNVNREAGHISRNKILLSFLIKDAVVQENHYEVSILLWQAALEARLDNNHEVSLMISVQSVSSHYNILITFFP